MDMLDIFMGIDMGNCVGKKYSAYEKTPYDFS